MQRVRHYIEYIFIVVLAFIVQNIPFKLGVFIMRLIGDIGFYVLKIRKKVALDNLRFALGDTRTEYELLDIARNVYHNFGIAILEIMRFPKMSLEDIKKAVVFEGKEYLDNALRLGKGGVIVSGHLGNIELLGQSFYAYGYPVSFLVGEQRNKFVDKIFNKYRSERGIKIIRRDFPLRNVMKTLKRNEFVTVVSDQDAGAGGVFVDFFGKKASTPQGAALFCLKSGAQMIFVCTVYSTERKQHRAIFTPVEIEKTGDLEKDIFTYTQKFTNILESFVRQYPDQYFWLHRRWKTRPPEE